MSYPLRISPEVQQALDHRQPLVALESTLITHGLPHPTNVDTALAMEAAVREGGAVPATIAVLDGIIIVGISEAQVRQLAAMPAGTVRKCSRRDLPIAIALRQHGATTVAGTMIVAHMVGIRVFATGGIGGVHRGLPQDISADLIELGRTAVTVVSSGAKSILDLPLTLEVLETQGVPVIGYQTEELPAFYALKSGLPVDQSVQCAEEVARIMESSRAIGARHGMLVTVPIPADSALDADFANAAIEQATAEAEAEDVSGKDITPYVLNRVSQLTGGKSLAANVALLVSNARVAGEIASELGKL